jgi:hypothetical protein
MASYYVDLSAAVNGSGSTGSPYNSMASLPTLAAGDVVEISRGTSQTMSGTYTVSASGSSAANRITIRANPATTGANPVLRIVSEGSVGITCTSRSYVTIENISIVGVSSWTNQNTAGVRVNGASTDILLLGVELQYCRFDLVGGFATNGVTITDCSAVEGPSDGIRLFSGTTTHTWQNVEINNGTFSQNGTAAGANGAGISVYIQPGHTGTTFQNFEITNCTIRGNYRAGVVCNDDSVAWATIIAAGNTTAPARQIKGLQIVSNTITGNGGAGISAQAAQPSSTRGVRIANNYLSDNSARTTLGNIWTGGCLTPVIEGNTCLRGNTNGTVVGDGCGVFDDQWNSGAIVRWNYIADNVYSATNPTYSAYGIGIYRSEGGQHYSNVIVNCRHGFVIGYLAGATAPIMDGIDVYNNTIADIDVYCFSIWTSVQAAAVNIKNNLLVNAAQDIEAQSGTAGNQTLSNNAAVNVTTKYTANNVGAGAFDHTLVALADMAANYKPRSDSALLGAGAHLGYRRDMGGKQRPNPPSIGAYDVATLRI